jgi:uncharacterized protein DUF6567
MNGVRIAVLLLAVALGASGCAQTGVFVAANMTSVELSEDNYRLIATDVSGTAEAAYLLGVSLPTGMMNSTLALVRLKGTGMLYQEALADLWTRFQEEHGAIDGRTLALVNVRYDSDNLNLLLYTRPQLSIRADVVEFVSRGE